MKTLLLLIPIFVLLGCSSNSQTDINWIRNHNAKTLQGATYAVEQKGNVKSDIAVLDKMKSVNAVINNLLDSLTLLPKSEILARANSLIKQMEYKTDELKKFYNITEQSSEDAIRLQLALLEFELLKHHSAYIGLRDISFDRMELRFVPTNISDSNITGELLFVASSNNLEDGAQMFINGKEVPIKNRVGLIDIPTSELNDGKLRAKVTFKDAEFELEEEIEVIKK